MNIITIPLDKWAGHDPEFKYDERTGTIKYIVLHSTDGTDSRDWLSKWNKKQETQQNNVSIHYLVQRDGLVYRIIADEKRAWHVGVSQMPDGETDGNSYAIGIELEHKNEPDYTDAQLNAAAALVRSLMAQYNITGDHVVSHASVARPLHRKIDPVYFNWADFWNRVLTSQEAPGAPVNSVPYSEYSLLVASPQIDAQKLTEYLVHKHTFVNYTKDDVRLILSYYYKYGAQSGIDYILAIAQMIHETGWLDSWWAARPRRNPAGIGVTGQSTAKNPRDDKNWAQSGAVWKRGQSFASWDISVQHHLSRLLLYALTDDQMTPEQFAFSRICGAHDRLARYRGVAHTLVGLNGTWAVPGKTYAQKLASIATAFVNQGSARNG